MANHTTIHEFEGGWMRVAVREHSSGKRYRVAIIKLGSTKGRLVQLECGGSEEVTQLIGVLKNAAAMAKHLEDGGSVEIWK
jgi:hypothetical protein